MLKAVMPTLVLIFFNYLHFSIDEEINKLLNTRFLKTQAMWFKSLMHMPVGVMIYDTKADSVLFENSQYKSMVDRPEHGGKEAC